MTALNVYIADDAVHLLTDGAACDGNGVLAGRLSKVVPLLHLSAVVAARGPMGFASVFAWRISEKARSFDDLVAQIEPVSRGVVATVFQHASEAKLGFDVVVAGISETRGPCAFVLATHSHHPGVPAWTVVEIPYILLMPPLADDVSERVRQASDPCAMAAEILQLQRGTLSGWMAPDGSRVGAFIEHTTVSAAGISSKIIGRWADEHGKPIDPERLLDAA